MGYKELMCGRGSELYFPDFQTQNSSRRWYQHDIDIIIYSEMFRKLQRKAQLLSIHDPVSRSRLIHTLEVVRIAKEISEKLGLNSELTEAIALGHDLGNVAYGKDANSYLQNKTNQHFKHEEASMLMLKVCASRIIPDKYRKSAQNAIMQAPSMTHIINIDEFPGTLEVYSYKRNIYYICLSPEVLDGILKHGTEKIADTLEGQVVNYADNIAYLIQDISDFEATEIFNNEAKKRYTRSLNTLKKQDDNDEYPIQNIVGNTTSQRTATLIERFVLYNSKKIDNQDKAYFSRILGCKIPRLEIENIVQQAIDHCWEFIEEFYSDDLINTSNITARAKMEQIWNILNTDSSFVEKNTSFIKFNKMLSSPIFNSYKNDFKIPSDVWENWKKAFFIAHLTCDEIDLIISSFLKRDYIFHLSLPKIIEQ